MNDDLEMQDIQLLIAQARRNRSIETGRLIAEGSQKLWRRALQLADRALHALLMSPTTSR